MKANLKKALLVPAASLLLASSIFLPTQIDHFKTWIHQARLSDTAAQVSAKTAQDEQAREPQQPSLLAVTNYLQRLTDDGCYADSQAIILQTLDGRVLVEHNADTPLNPASVMKLSTSYLALKHYGPDYRFKTIAYTYGKIDEATQTLYGDLIIEGEGDPNFTTLDAGTLAASIRSQGIRRVEGNLRIVGPLRLRHIYNLETTVVKLKAALGITFPKPAKAKNGKAAPAVETATSEVANQNGEQKIDQSKSKAERILLGSHYSESLRELLLYMNAHSDNFYAEQLGWAVGGPSVAQEELTAEFHLVPGALYISHTSGLDYNRITPRASIAIQHKMIKLLQSFNMRIEDIMPVAGVDSGTLTRRLLQPGIVGSIVAKTGTLNVTDNGVSALQGVIYTQQYGPLMFSIFNMGGAVHYFRRQQDLFLCDVISELNVGLQTVRTDNILQAKEELMAAELPMKRNVRVKGVSAKRSNKYKQTYRSKPARNRRR